MKKSKPPKGTGSSPGKQVSISDRFGCVDQPVILLLQSGKLVAEHLERVLLGEVPYADSATLLFCDHLELFELGVYVGEAVLVVEEDIALHRRDRKLF